jgi:hypothetical protein
MEKNERVLLVASAKAAAARVAKRVAAEGGEAIIIASVAEAKAVVGAFDRGIFTFDLPDGSGVVLAAELMIESRIREIEFLHPAEELVACDRHCLRSAAGAIDSKQPERSVA